MLHKKKTVRSHSPDEKYNLLAGEGGVGSVASGSAATGDRWRQVLILLILILILSHFLLWIECVRTVAYEQVQSVAHSGQRKGLRRWYMQEKQECR